MEIYASTIIGLALACLIPLVLANLVGPKKGGAGLIGGPVPDARDENPLFRLDRAHQNSVESIPVFVAVAVLAMLVGVAPGFLAIVVWAFLALRLAYVVVYVRGGALGKGGSLRTLIYVGGALCTLLLIGAIIVAAL